MLKAAARFGDILVTGDLNKSCSEETMAGMDTRLEWVEALWEAGSNKICEFGHTAQESKISG